MPVSNTHEMVWLPWSERRAVTEATGSTDKVKFHPNNMLLCVMGATSDDGIHWKKTDQPLLIEPQRNEEGSRSTTTATTGFGRCVGKSSHRRHEEACHCHHCSRTAAGPRRWEDT